MDSPATCNQRLSSVRRVRKAASSKFHTICASTKISSGEPLQGQDSKPCSTYSTQQSSRQVASKQSSMSLCIQRQQCSLSSIQKLTTDHSISCLMIPLQSSDCLEPSLKALIANLTQGSKSFSWSCISEECDRTEHWHLANVFLSLSVCLLCFCDLASE